MARPSGRKADQLRSIEIIPGVNKHAEGSCMVKFGDTHILCLATVEEKVPGWMKGTGTGWVTGEYGMLPRSTGTRMDREAAKGRQSGRTQEIQRLVGRALRSVVDLKAVGERQVRIDCDVIQADGGTRTAAITGGFVAMNLAFDYLMKIGAITKNPVTDTVAAISCGFFDGEAVLDLDYEEDSNAGADANFVITGSGALIEVQATAERTPFSEEDFLKLLKLAKKGCTDIRRIQQAALAGKKADAA
jgi:ribonuclease PH